MKFRTAAGSETGKTERTLLRLLVQVTIDGIVSPVFRSQLVLAAIDAQLEAEDRALLEQKRARKDELGPKDG